MPEQIISNASIVLADEIIVGSIKIEDGKIADINEGTIQSASLDFSGDYLIPGLIELHTDNLDRHVMPRPPKSYWPTESAVINHDREMATAGITTVYDALAVGHNDKSTKTPAVIKNLSNAISDLQANRSLKVDHFVHWRCEVSGDDTYDQAEELSKNPVTGLFSVMDHTPGPTPVRVY